MTPDFSVKFVIDRISGQYRLQFEDLSDYTGVATAYGFYKITYPDGIFYENTDSENPDFELGDVSTDLSLRMKNSQLIQGQYVIVQKIYANTGYFSSTKTVTFNFSEPTQSLVFAGNLLTPTVIFEDTTAYNLDGYTEAISRLITCVFPTTSGIVTEITSTGTTITMVDSGDYYEGVYLPTLRSEVTFTGSNFTIEWSKETEFEISVKRLLNYSELLTLFNTLKARLDSQEGTQNYQSTLENYQSISALFSHIELKIKDGESGIDQLMLEIQDLVYKANCCQEEDYEYSSDPLTPFDESEVVESGFNSVADADGVIQFTSATDKKLRFEGDGVEIDFDPLTNKVIIRYVASESFPVVTEEFIWTSGGYEFTLENVIPSKDEIQDIFRNGKRLFSTDFDYLAGVVTLNDELEPNDEIVVKYLI